MNRLNIKSIFAAVAIASVTFTSCDGYLETFPSDSLVSTDAITTLQDVETALNGTYYSLKSANYYGCDFVSRAEVGGEDVQTISSGGLRTDTYYRFTHRQNNSPENLWSYPYAVINRANVLLNAIETGDLPAGDELNNAKGEALALRALCHFNLLITYGKPYFVENGATPGVVLVKNVLSADDLPSRSTVAEGYEMVINDLEEALKPICKKPMDVHLMIVEPQKFIPEVAATGAYMMNVHYEACTHLHRTVAAIKEAGMKAAVTLNPHTSISLLEDILQDLDMVLLMSVNPGYGGQKFIEHSIDKTARLKDMILAKGLNTLIEVDGGVNMQTAKPLLEVGADVLVAGSFVFRSPDPLKTIRELKEL